VSKPFFLTRQTANLMEEFARELKAQAGLYLIHGDEGVGKTRLLVELAGSRLVDHKVRWMDLKAGSSGDGVLIDSSVLIEKTFARASPGDVIIADHFEMAMKKTRHQLFLSWSTDGLDKNLNLIISASSDYFNELKQLAQQYNVRVQSFQQMPFSPDEANAFLGFYLFPDRAVGELLIPPLLRNQLAMAQGNVAKIIEIAERAGDQISSAPISDSKSNRQDSSKIVGVAVAALLLLGGGWYYLGKLEAESVPPLEAVAQVTAGSDSVSAQTEADSMPVPSGSSETVEATAAADLAVAEAVEPTAMQADDGFANQADDALPQAEFASTAATEAGIDGEVVIETQAEEADASLAAVDPPTQPDEPPVDISADAGDSNSNELVADSASETVSAGSDPVEQSALRSPRLRQDLQASLDWINAREKKTGTLQIMSVSQDRFDEQAYYRRLAKLASQGVDVSRIRIFESFTGNKPVLSVVYGEYPSRSAANRAKPDLAPVLRKFDPIGRSVGGLLVEIQRLREQN